MGAPNFFAWRKKNLLKAVNQFRSFGENVSVDFFTHSVGVSSLKKGQKDQRKQSLLKHV